MRDTLPASKRAAMVGNDPQPKSPEIRRRLQTTKQKDTPAELSLRRELFRRGLRYRLNTPIAGVTRGRPDIVFPRARVAVFVDGCFWHSCPHHGSLPVHNRAWWSAKLGANVDRDQRHTAELEGAGWTVFRFWEHENPSDAADQIERTVRGSTR